ncbi:MAG: hypothetical protein HRU09_14785 [Oligoflexales bacterium]|nr:hypothetical protein [Oligoflexales bacterium]
MSKKILSRRDLLKLGSSASLLSMTSSLPGIGPSLFAQAAQKPKYLFVIACAGGSSILDSFMAQTSGPTAFGEQQISIPQGSNLSCVLPLDNSIQGAIPLGNGFSQETFLNKHKDDMVVMTQEVSSVNHVIAAKRSISGNNINSGRTITEAMAMQYGNGFTIPNANMAGGGYSEDGDDESVLAAARTQPIADPLMFAFATSGFQGIRGSLSGPELEIARLLRTDLEGMSQNHKFYMESSKVKTYLSNRANLLEALEKGNTMSKLMLFNDQSVNLAEFGISLPDSFTMLAERFNLADPMESKVALAYLLAKEKISCSVTIAPGQDPNISAEGSPNAPIAFDWSHVDHRGAQNAMWSYMLKSTDALIDLLKATDIDGDPANGKMWDQSMIYFATEFGRDKVSSGGSGHHLNNGSLLISPMLNGNAIYGGVGNDGITYGFEPQTGIPDPNRMMHEEDVYSAVAMALGIDFDGRTDLKAMVKGA